MRPVLSAAAAFVVFMTAAPPIASQSALQIGGRSLLLDSRADIATDGTYLYGVAAKEQVLVRRPVVGTPSWEPLAIGRSGAAFGQIGGMAAVPGTLVVVDSRNGGRLATISTRPTESGLFAVAFTELKAKRPESVAVAGGQVFVADPDAGIVLQVAGGEVRGEFMSELLERRPGLRIFLSGDGASLFVGRSDGLLAQIDSVYLSDKVTPLILQRPTFDAAVQVRSPSQLSTRGLSAEEARAVRPIAAGLHQGISYLADAAARGVYAFEPSSRRPIHIDDPVEPILGANRIAVTDRTLFILSSDGELREIERPIPVEVVAERTSVTGLIPGLYQYLREKRLLATRRVQVAAGLMATLRRSKLLGGTVLPEEMRAVVCDLNGAFCPRGELRDVADGEWIVLPDWYAENFIDQIRVSLNGTKTLAAEIDQHIVSREFDAWKSIDKIRSLNVGKITASQTLKDIRTGSFLLPVELIRYLIPASRADGNASRGSGPLADLAKRVSGVRIRSLERLRAAAAGFDQPTAADWKPLADAHDKMRAKIKAENIAIARGPNAPEAKVGVADTFIDRKNPDFGEAFSQDEGTAQPAPRAPDAVARPAGTGSAAPQPAPAAQVWHELNKDIDHGTAVASLIGAAKFQFDRTGLAAGVPMLALRKDEPFIETDVRDAVLSSNVPIFNFSFSYDPGVVPPLGTMIDNLPQALFVVAAANSWTKKEDDGRICEGTLVIFPQCYASKPNVIVVTGTNIDGTQLIAPVQRGTVTDEGANWNPQLVHLAAPGEGYYASGYPGGYVPVRGSSFAAPLVTAAAAVLYSEGVTSPVLIKQRLIATADRVPTLTKYVQGGLLNVDRAVSFPAKAVVTEANKKPRAISLLRSDDITIKRANGTTGEIIPVRYIRRIIRVDNNVRILYATTSSSQASGTRVEIPEELRVLEVPAGNWVIKYKELDQKTLLEVGPKKELNLGTVEDYVGPIQ
jgi:hypothetical protein